MKLHSNLKLNQVRAARERTGLTREQLAVKAGVSSTTLYLAERAGLMSATTAAKLALILGTSADALLANAPRRGAAPIESDR
jgi:DNA-binding XRE family transcriptional regulator